MTVRKNWEKRKTGLLRDCPRAVYPGKKKFRKMAYDVRSPTNK